jgi:hypothetical protein
VVQKLRDMGVTEIAEHVGGHGVVQTAGVLRGGDGGEALCDEGEDALVGLTHAKQLQRCRFHSHEAQWRQRQRAYRLIGHRKLQSRRQPA